uniref:Bm12899, isoform a n=1 Tax=Brugia malayi TaxID=6279 RepID=A0A1I9G5Y9_BRUMA|nr:Bm12899, isoform a [Brugia malayi]
MWELISKDFQASFAVGVYVGIYLDQNRQIQAVSSPKELFSRFLDEADHFLTGVREENSQDQLRKVEDDFFKDVEDWFKPKKRFP